MTAAAGILDAMPEEKEERRRPDSRIDELRDRSARVESRVDGLAEAFREHDRNNMHRFGEVHDRISDIGKQVARLETRVDINTQKHDTVIGKLDILLDQDKAHKAITTYRDETVRRIPAALKWIAGILAGIVAVAVAWGELTRLVHVAN